MGISLTTCKRDMNLAPIIFATLVMSAFAAMPLKPDDALTGLLDEEPATPKTTPKNTPMTTPMTTPRTSLIDAFLDTKSKAGCVDCTGRERASDESGKGNINGVDQTGMSYCYRKDGDLANDPNVCDGYWGGSVDNPTYGTAYYACELGVKTKNGIDRNGCINGPECCLDANGDFAAPTTAPTTGPTNVCTESGVNVGGADGTWDDACTGVICCNNEHTCQFRVISMKVTPGFPGYYTCK